MGGTARCTRGYWDEDPAMPYAITYRWYREGVAIPGATTNQLAITSADIGDEFACAAIAEAQTEASSEPLEVRPPELQYSPRPSACPTRAASSLPARRVERQPRGPYDVTTAWLRDGEPLVGYSDVYTVTTDDIGHDFSCKLTAEGEWTEESRSTYGTWEPVELRFTPLDEATAPGATNGYTVSFRNLSPVEATFESLVVILPEGSATARRPRPARSRPSRRGRPRTSSGTATA